MAFKFYKTFAAKLSLQLSLFTVCLFVFGFPSIEKYKAEETIVTTKEEKKDEILAPAVTICAINKNNLNGFKTVNHVSNFGDILQAFCSESTNMKSCIDGQTYNLSETVMNATKGISSEAKNLIGPHLWISDFSGTYFGQCFTLNTSISMDLQAITGTLRISLAKDLNYNIFVHDLNYFLINVNPYGIPNNYRIVSGDQKSAYYKMRTVRKENIRDCNDDISYSFTSCVKRSAMQYNVI